MTKTIATLGAVDTRSLIEAANVCKDALYLPQAPGLLEPMELAGYLASLSLDLKLFVGQRVGVVAPTMCSRMFATLDQLNAGRIVAVLDLAADQSKADGLDPESLPQRANEYAQIMRNLWAADQPLDHAGAFYRFNKARTVVPPLQKPMPIFLAASPDDALNVDAQNFDGVIITQNADDSTLQKLKSAYATVLLSISVRDAFNPE